MQTRRDVLATAATGILTTALCTTNAGARSTDDQLAHPVHDAGHEFGFVNAHAIRTAPELPAEVRDELTGTLDERVGHLRIDPADVTALVTGDDYLHATGTFDAIEIRLAMLFGEYEGSADHGDYRVYDGPADAVAFADGELFRGTGPLDSPAGVRRVVDVALDGSETDTNSDDGRSESGRDRGDVSDGSAPNGSAPTDPASSESAPNGAATNRSGTTERSPHESAVRDLIGTLADADVVLGRRLADEGGRPRGLGSATTVAVSRAFAGNGAVEETYAVGFDRPGGVPIAAFERHVERENVLAHEGSTRTVTERNGCLLARVSRPTESLETVTPTLPGSMKS